jgi:protein ImuB
MKLTNYKKRALCLWLPHWPIQRLYNVRPELRRTPLVVYEEYRPGTFRVLDCCPLAQRQGVRPLMPLTEATALADPHLEKFDPQQDRLALLKVAKWCEQFSPAIAIEEPDCLLMDVTGLVPIFGSEQALVTQIRREFHERRLVMQVAVTDTYAAAWALSHYSRSTVVIVPPGEVIDAISTLPTAALKLDEQIEATLQELGVETIGQLAAIPRDEVASRFNPTLIDRLDQASGRLLEAVEPYYAPPELTRTLEFEAPISNREALGTVAIELLSQIIPFLASQQRGITKFVCEFVCEHEPTVRMTVGLYQPTTIINHLGELALLQLETLKFTGPISKVRLLVCGTARLQVAQLELFDVENVAEQNRQLALLVNRLSSRLGQSAVVRPVLVPDAKAEFSYRYQSLTENNRRSIAKLVKPCGPLQRPIHLLPKIVPLQVLGMLEGPPKVFHWRGESFDIKRVWGPERIQAGWWHGRYEKRDYYRVETDNGNRFWLFRRGDGAWFLHGIFD